MKNITRLTLTVAALFATAAIAGKAQRKEFSLREKNQAPNIETYAEYFRGAEFTGDLKKEAEADKLRVKSIQAILEMLKKESKKGPRQFELMLRLGELYVERHDFLRELEIDKFQRDFDSWQKKQQAKEPVGKEPVANFDLSKKEMNNAANTFRSLATSYPKHPRTANVLFVLAKTLSRLNLDSAVLYYEKILKDHPKSDLVPDTHLALGEHYFDKHNVEKAIECYKKAMAFKNHRAYPYAVYKLGWAHYNRTAKNEADEKDNLNKSIAAFKLVIRLSDKNKKANTNSSLDLREEAVKDLIMVWADAEDINSAWSYFKTIGEENSFYVMLERLGGIYASQGKNQQAIVVYTRLLKEAPLRESNPEVHLKLVELQDLVGKPTLAHQELEVITKTYLGDTAWTKAFPAKKQEIADKIERSTHRYGALYHNRGIKAKSDDFLKVAARIYALYLASFPSNENAYEIRFYFAEIMHEFKSYDVAATQYLQVSAQKPTNGKYSKDSATNAVIAMNSLVAGKTYEKLPPPGQVPSPLTIPAEKIKLVQALDNYSKNFSTDKDSHPMRITAAKIYFEYGHYTEAMPRFIKITDDIPATPQAEAAAQTVIGFYAEKSDWPMVVQHCQHFEKNKTLMAQTKIADKINAAYRAAAFNIALNLEKSQKHKEAAEAFVAFEQKFKNDKNAERSLYNAGINYYKAGQVKKAVEIQVALLKSYPNTSLKADVLASLGETHEALVQFKEAADYYAQLGTQFPNDARSAKALMNSAVLYNGIEDYAAADRSLTRFVQSFSKHELYADALFELAKVKETQQQWNDAKKYYNEFSAKYSASRPDEAVLAHARVAVISQRLNDTKKGEGFHTLGKKLTGNQKLVAYDARQIAAEEKFNALTPQLARFKEATLNPEKLEDSIKGMQDQLLKLTQGYEDVMTLGSGEYIVASLYRMGEMHEVFSDKLLKAPVSAKASPAEINQIRSALEGLAFPLKEEAYKFYETAYKKSSEVGTFTHWTKLTYEKMSDLEPTKHPNVDALILKPTYMTHRISMEKE